MLPSTKERTRPQIGTSSESIGQKLKSTVAPVYGVRTDPALFLAALLQDLLNQGTVGHWLRRAEEWDRIDALTALQCRRHAWLLAEYQSDEVSPEVWAALEGAAA